MNEEEQLHQLLGQVHYREKRKDVHEERDAYKKALENIIKAETVRDMLNIAYSVLAENRK